MLAATFKSTSLIVIPRAHLADSTDYRCAKPSRFICHCPRNPRFHFFRHYTHWHRLASHRLLHFTGASWIRCPQWLLAFGHSTALNNFSSVILPRCRNLLEGFSNDPTLMKSIAAHLHTHLQMIQSPLQSSDLHAPHSVLDYTTFRFVTYRMSKLLYKYKKSLYNTLGRLSPSDTLVK